MSAKIPQTKNINKDVVIFQAKSGAIELRGDFRADTIWATQAQIADVFGSERSVVTKHIRNILNDKELDRNSVCAFFAHTAADGKTYKVQTYNLDVILAVGYRVNSNRAVEFRQWATKTLRAHIVDGYTINKERIGKNYEAFMEAVRNVRALLPANTATGGAGATISTISTADILELISAFADTWFSLNAFDKGEFSVGKPTKKKVALTAEKLHEHVALFKNELMKKGEATDIFAAERTRGALEGIVGNVMQAFGGRDMYASVEEKAAHLLYFIVKNHPFVDGNKRTGAYAFVWLLRVTGVLDVSRLTPAALTAVTLLIAESNPRDKEKMVGLVVMLIKK